MSDATIIDARGKWVTPGIVAGFSRLGLAEELAAKGRRIEGERVGDVVARLAPHATLGAPEREAAIVAEFPTIAELLALAVTAGEGPVGALERVNRISTGELSKELGRALADAMDARFNPVAVQGEITATESASVTKRRRGSACLMVTPSS